MILLLSSIFLIIPPIIGNFVGPIEQLIQLAMFLIVITSLVHWNNPVRNTFNSRFDSRLVKSTIIFTSIYALFFKGLHEQQRNFVIFLMACLAFSFYKGSQASSKEWCSDDHLVKHYFVHMFGILAGLAIFT